MYALRTVHRKTSFSEFWMLGGDLSASISCSFSYLASSVQALTKRKYIKLTKVHQLNKLHRKTRVVFVNPLLLCWSFNATKIILKRFNLIA